MNEMLEAWKQIPDVSDEFSPPPQSQLSSKGIDLYLYLLFVCICRHCESVINKCWITLCELN